jgi:probable rRNA maturation factor
VPVYFHCENINFTLSNKSKIRSWIELVISKNKKNTSNINIIFCNDNYIIDINKKYLSHDYYTDIITFDNSISNDISADIFISIDRVKDNANKIKIDFNTELHRVIIHGILHLCGFNDKLEEEKNKMRSLEDKYLSELII